MEERIVAYLRKHYNPLAIALIGSRVNGSDHDNSDWDLSLFVQKLPDPDFKYEETEYGLLDIVFYEKPDADFVFETALAPVPNVKVLYDHKDILKASIAKTKKRYAAGPPKLKPEEIATWKLRLQRFFQKAHDASTELERRSVQSNILVNLLLPLWFDLHGEWSRPIHEIEKHIASLDPDFYVLVNKLAVGETVTYDELEPILFR